MPSSGFFASVSRGVINSGVSPSFPETWLPWGGRHGGPIAEALTVDGGGPSATPLTAFDKVAADMHVAVLFAFAAPTATNAQIKDGLAKTLAHFYTFAGRLGPTSAAARVSSPAAPATGLCWWRRRWSRSWRANPAEALARLQKLHRQTEGAVHALQVQLNRFRCGGLVIGVTCHHRVADGRRPQLVLHYSGEFIAKALKEQTMEKYTTFRDPVSPPVEEDNNGQGLNGEEFTQVRVAVDGRRRLTPPVPAEFTGTWSSALTPAGAKELLGGGLEGAAALIRAAVRRTGGVLPVLRTSQRLEGDGAVPRLEVNSWLGFRFSDMEFGGGEGGVCAFAPSWITRRRRHRILPLREGDGGVDVVVTLFESHAKLLRQISHSVD
ncbi:unnamed protein product [Spirodela intermedia]|uniref:Uncharacterized protein n=1 Tax=Spirodela intermedia TaxID=51605 RepID=A0A7I8I9N0_SPIIN|nr:unnamed protein product [Spirodela intermedia]CAA6654416.1 unnamed protein product [Spirodela intermedia]